MTLPPPTEHLLLALADLPTPGRVESPARTHWHIGSLMVAVVRTSLDAVLAAAPESGAGAALGLEMARRIEESAGAVRLLVEPPKGRRRQCEEIVT
jgi:hypothetical protein